MDGIEASKRPIKEISFCINNVQYIVACALSANDLIQILDFCKREQGDYRELLAQIVRKKAHIVAEPSLPSVEQALVLNDEILTEFINGVLERNREYQAIYAQLDCYQDQHERFARAIEKSVSDSIVGAMKPFDWGPTIQALNDQTQQLREIVQKTITATVQGLAEHTKRIVESTIGPIQKMIQELGELAREMRTPALTDSKKEALIDSYQKWGEYGWTMTPEMIYGFFEEPPVDRKSANKEALKYCSNGDMSKLFNQLRKMEGVKLSDLEEAVFDFEQRKYKSCVMIVHSLLDAKLIRLQKQEDRRGKKNMRPSGVTAGENVISRICNLPEEQQNLWIILMCTNILSSIKELFKPGDDFVKQPDEANRNFISHGMLTRSVKRMDCVKAFLLYYNLLQLINWTL